MTARDRWRALRAWRRERRLAGPRLLRRFAKCYPEAFFVEIGANDGVQYDPLRDHILNRQWQGLMVEPVPEVFARLEHNFATVRDRVTLVNAAIAQADGTAPFFQLARSNDTNVEVLDVFGSLSADAVRRSGELFVAPAERRTIEIQVQTLTFESLCDRYSVDRIDLLTIDAEGSDAEILRQIDLQSYRPRLLCFEHLFLDEAEFEQCRQRLECAGYETLSERRDTWCLDARINDHLTAFWRRLSPSAAADSIVPNGR